MKVFLVSSYSLPLLGAEKCQAFRVPPALEAAFIREYGSRILTSGSHLVVSLPIPIRIYKGL